MSWCMTFLYLFPPAEIDYMVQYTTLYTVKGNAIIHIFIESDLFTQCKVDPQLAVD